MYEIPAIETEYRGAIFRSRLEARWAAFFDLVKWPWVYEPLDLNGWIPDFMLGRDLLVEVKPFSAFDEFDEAVWKASLAVKNTPWQHKELLLLGLGPFCGNSGCGSIALGWLGENVYSLDWYLDCGLIAENDCGCTLENALTHSCQDWWQFDEANIICECRTFDLCSSTGSWHGRFNGIENDHGECFGFADDWEKISTFWNKAHKLTRWER